MIGNPMKASQPTPQTSPTATPQPTHIQNHQTNAMNTLTSVAWAIAGMVILLFGWGYVQRYNKMGKEKLKGGNVAVNWHNFLILSAFYIFFAKAIPATMALVAKYKIPGTKWLGTLFNPTN